MKLNRIRKDKLYDILRTSTSAHIIGRTALAIVDEFRRRKIPLKTSPAFDVAEKKYDVKWEQGRMTVFHKGKRKCLADVWNKIDVKTNQLKRGER